MNINTSTGGPHLLLFERDQQFATLLTSELQLAGYTNHIARTAVEVFDAISRYPIRLVLVDLAQAAAARREFWVALDSQRRDRKVQVLTFVCTNLAGYGPRDLDDHIQNAHIDMEIDGMLGLMSLVDAVRTRVPNATIDTNTQPRLQRFSSQQIPTAPQPSMQMPHQGNSGPFPVQVPSDTGMGQALHRSGSPFLPQTPIGTPVGQGQGQAPINQNPQPSPATGLSGSSQPSYSEKIRAVLYPNQRAWNTQDEENLAPNYEMKNTTNTMPSVPPIQPANASNEPTMLQRLASGHLPHVENPQNESGLAQLSRLVQGFRSASPQKEEPAAYIPPTPQQQPVTQWQPAQQQQQPSATQWPPTPTPQQPSATQWSTAPTPQQPSATQWSTTPTPQQQQPITQWQPAPTQQQPSATQWSTINAVPYTQQVPVERKEAAQNQTYLNNPGSNMHPALESTREREIEQSQTNNQQNQVHTYSTFVIPTTRTAPDEKIGAQPLRASPIQDMPLERTVAGPPITEQPKRPDVLSRSNYGQQIVPPATPSNTAHLASIATPMPPPIPKETMAPAALPEAEPVIEEAQPPATRYEPLQENEPSSTINRNDKVKPKAVAYEEEKPVEQIRLPEDLAESMTTNNAVLLDIVQSLPPMPALGEQPQSIQAQALNGRATRSLNKVLLDGHLVPQDRLDVAQNIQRMLRGVDLNYQLGEILLMFKLLTPDQLLAASLVSYGLITTTQISALGRIRQELYAIGLEYDLENLLIVFRILTTEQLREARSSLQS